MINSNLEGFMITNITKLDNLVNNAITKFNENEIYLLKNDVNERGICSKFAVYLEYEIRNDNELSEYNVDTEFNRGYNGDDSAVKRLNEEPISIDLIVHKRGYDYAGIGYDNLICMEMKKVKNREGYRDDEERLRDLTDPDKGFWYKIGYMIRISQKKCKLEIKNLFIGGKLIEKDKIPTNLFGI
jgi:hypothetical protein